MINIGVFLCLFVCFILSLEVEKGISKGKGNFWKCLKKQRKGKRNQIRKRISFFLNYISFRCTAL